MSINIKTIKKGDILKAAYTTQTNNQNDRRRVLDISDDGEILVEAVGDSIRPLVGSHAPIHVFDGDRSWINRLQYQAWKVELQ